MGRKARQVHIPHKPLGRGATISKISDQESLVLRGWKDGSVFKKTGCSARIQVRFPGPHRGSELPPTSVPEDVMLSSGLHRHETLMWYADTRASKTPIHIKTEKRKQLSMYPKKI